MSRDKAETVPKRWNIYPRENLKADHYLKNTSCKQWFVVQKEYLPTKVLIVFLFLSFCFHQGVILFRGWRWGFGGGGGGIQCVILILPLLCGAPWLINPTVPQGVGGCYAGSCTPPRQGSVWAKGFVYTRKIIWITKDQLFRVILKVSLSISSLTVGALSRVFTECCPYCLSPSASTASLLRGLFDPEK